LANPAAAAGESCFIPTTAAAGGGTMTHSVCVGGAQCIQAGCVRLRPGTAAGARASPFSLSFLLTQNPPPIFPPSQRNNERHHHRAAASTTAPATTACWKSYNCCCWR
jgi:hypothetical protein